MNSKPTPDARSVSAAAILAGDERGIDSSRALLLEALRCAAESLDVPWNQESSAVALRHASGDVLSRQPGNWSEVLAQAGDRLGLHFTVARRKLGEVLASASSSAPWFAIVRRGEQLSDVLAILDGGGSRARVRQMSATEPRSMSRDALRELLGPDPIEFLIVEPAAPLSETGEHHHDDHAWHGVHPFERLKAWMRAERRDLWVAVIYSAAVGMLSLVVPIATQTLVNQIAFGMLLQPLVILCLLVLLGLAFSGALLGLRFYVVEVIQRRVFVRISTDVVYRLLRVRMAAFDRGYGPELVNRFFEVATVQKAGALLVLDGLSIVMQAAIGMTVMAFYHPILLGFDVVLLGAVLFILFPLGAGAVDSAVRESKAKYSMAAWLEELARHPIAFKAAGGVSYAVERADALAATYLHHRAAHFRVLLRQKIGLVALHALGTAALLGVGGWLVIQTQLTIGQLVAAELIVTAVLTGLTKFAKQLETFYDLLAAVDKLGYFTDLPMEASGSEALTVEGPAQIRLRNVDFRYEDRSAPVLKQLNWEIPAGSRMGIVAGSGSGKSTLLDVVYGLRPAAAGVVEIDGRDYRELRLNDLRDQIAMVRENEVFHGTVADNVRLGSLRVGTGEIRAALAMAGVLDEVLDLPQGIHTELSTGGLPLSPGGAMRLMLARAIVTRPRLLILDEALDGLDDAFDSTQLVERLFDPANPWTLLVTTTRPEVLARCHRVFTLRDGALVESQPAKEVK